MELYDSDGDGKLSPEEQKGCPSIAENVKHYDKDDDGVVSREELQARIEAWMDEGTGLMSYSVGVKFKGRPLAGAEVELQPVEFLQAMLKTGSGTTNERGQAAISVSEKDLPETHTSRRMMPPGLYTVRITHPRVKLSSRFNSETQLGCEVSVEAGNPAFPIWFRVSGKKK